MFKKHLKYHVINKFTNLFLFKLTYNLCEFKNEFFKSLTMLFSLCKTCPFKKKLHVFILSYMIR
jgi:hypothetical protein